MGQPRIDPCGAMTDQPAFLTPDRSERVEMAVDTRRTRGTRLRVGPRKRTVRYVEEADRVQRGQGG
jgi:hypothetical protein